MGSLRNFFRFSNISTPENFQRWVSSFSESLVGEINGRLDFVSNIRASGPFVLGFTSVSQVFGVTHGLGVVPTGFLTLNITASSVLFAPSGVSFPWTDSKIYLKASAGCTAIIYVMP